MLKGKKILALGIETTGLSLDSKIVQITAILHCDGEILTKLETKLNPLVAIPIEASNIHNIYDKDVVDAPLFDDISDQILHLLDSCDIIEGCGILNYHLPVLIKHLGMTPNEFEVLCNMINYTEILDWQYIAKRYNTGNLKYFSLKEIYRDVMNVNLPVSDNQFRDNTVYLYEMHKPAFLKYIGYSTKDKNILLSLKNVKDYVLLLNIINDIETIEAETLDGLNDNNYVFTYGINIGNSVTDYLKKCVDNEFTHRINVPDAPIERWKHVVCYSTGHMFAHDYFNFLIKKNIIALHWNTMKDLKAVSVVS